MSAIGNALLGIAFWAVAAKAFSPHDLGVMTAVLAVIMSTGVVAATGIGDSYTALLPAVGDHRPQFYRRGQRLFLVLAAIGATAAGLGTVTLLSEVYGSIAVGALVAIGTIVWAATTLQNSTLVALGRASWLPAANLGLSAGKLALLPLLAVMISWHPVELSVVATAVVVVAVLGSRITRIVDSGEQLPASTIPGGLSVRRFYSFVGQTTLSSALTMGLFLVSPFLVTVWSTPSQGALFALSLSVVQALDLLGAALSTSLVVHASSHPDQAAAMARSILIKAVLLSVVGAALLIAVAPVALRLLNPLYGEMGAASVIATLAVGTICRLVYQVWSALQRARRKMLAPLALTVVSAAVLLLSMPTLCAAHGAVGGAQALLLAQLAMIVGIGIHFLASRNRIGAVGAG
ncbi:MAG: lipopolysaccharide biosynthesis protein [Mycobacterium sp.]